MSHMYLIPIVLAFIFMCALLSRTFILIVDTFAALLEPRHIVKRIVLALFFLTVLLGGIIMAMLTGELGHLILQALS